MKTLISLMTLDELVTAYKQELTRVYGADVADAACIMPDAPGHITMKAVIACVGGSFWICPVRLQYRRKDIEALLVELRAPEARHS